MATALKIAAVQMKFRKTVPENTGRIVAVIETAARRGADAILFPECAVTGYRPDMSDLKPDAVEQSLAEIASAAKRAACNVLVGSPYYQKGKWFNALLGFDRRGRKILQYSKIHLTDFDARFFTRGNSLAFFHLDGIPATAILCHERRYPELVRLPVMMGATIVFHPNAGLDKLSVSKTKRNGKDGIAVRAFENQIYYVFANSVGPQGGGLWSAGDSKIVAPDSRVLALANNVDETLIQARVDLSKAGRKYAREALQYPEFLSSAWKEMLALSRRQLKETDSAMRRSRRKS